ncbi:PREDICTED: uncharacterized protein LOC109177629 [Ipomoea nil]|uniref:uncharacterized protein LOC109177629 n=1 Tax=Ipomoea nil TaxID=35883 RepID=UPI000900879D|nr:PREDICTED: uncharacterized protein LOC109177629 [Ipomoea nil]
MFNAPVSSLFNEHKAGWDEECVRDVFNVKDSDIILNIPVSVRLPPDVWVRYDEPKGEYSVKSCYRLLVGEFQHHRKWSAIWNMRVPPKVLESAKHMFMDCHQVACMLSTMGLSMSSQGGRELVDWFFEQLENLSREVAHETMKHQNNVTSTVYKEKWNPPTSGRIKLNCDAAFDASHNIMGLGWVLMDDWG